VILALGLLQAMRSGSAEPLPSECDDPQPGWLACEDFEAGGLGWEAWFEQSAWVECLGCSGGLNNPARIRLVNDRTIAHSGEWLLHMPAEASAGYQGASLTFRTCEAQKRPGCRLTGYQELYFRAWVRLAEDHEYVHHFLELAGTRPDAYWESDGNAGCRPDGVRWAGTTLDFNRQRELFFYTYYPEMRCDSGGYCSGDYARRICQGCAQKNMPCRNRLECCWGNHFGPQPPVILERGRWVCLEMHMRLNTPGQARLLQRGQARLLQRGQADGSMSFWVDGQPAHEQTGMHWRDVPELQLNKAWLQHYIAGGDADQSNRIWFDDVVVSTQRIGCGIGPEEPTATVTPQAVATTQTPTQGAREVRSPTPADQTLSELFLPWAGAGYTLTPGPALKNRATGRAS
jgi:hypothetical protein